MFHLEERVLWFCLSKVKAHVAKQPWGTGVDTLKLGSKEALKTFILKMFATQKFTNYEIKIGNPSLLQEVSKVSILFVIFILNFDTFLFSWRN
jgi:hypothetical protein